MKPLPPAAAPAPRRSLPIRQRLRRFGLLLASVVAAIPASIGAAHAQAPQGGHAFDVAREGTSIEVRASATVRADRATVWRTLVDYTHLPDFIPDMQSSELIERRGDDLLLRQAGRAGLGPFTQTFSLTLAVRETPMREVAAQAISGDFHSFKSSYLLSSADDDGTTRIDYLASMEPKAVIPPLIGMPVMRTAMRRQFEALLAEVERRYATAQ